MNIMLWPVLKVVSKRCRGSWWWETDNRAARGLERDGLGMWYFPNLAHKNDAFWCLFHTVLHSQLAWCGGSKHWGRGQQVRWGLSPSTPLIPL